MAGDITALEEDLGDPSVLDRISEKQCDVIFHLAAVPGGAAERDYGLGWGVNFEASVALLDAISNAENPPRVVFASSIGIFGVPLPSDRIDDETLPIPTMSYGAQKLMIEILLADYTRRGLIDGLAVRLPGIIARPRQPGGHLSAYMSDILHALAAGETFTCPVSQSAASWFMSRERCIDNLIHAATLPSESIGTRRAFNLPALHLTMDQLVGGAAEHFGRSAFDRVTYQPNSALQAQFGAYPKLLTPIADGLGFRHDEDAGHLVFRALGMTGRT